MTNLARPAGQRAIIGALVSLLLLVGALPAQYYYSKNKVQTKNYDFRTITTVHFTIYFYTGGEVLADYSARIAEEFYNSISSDLGVRREGRIPIIIYNSPNEFEETNVVQDIIEEGVGGFSELFKNRVVLPFDGSYARYKKVLWHEITHILEFELFYKPQLANVLSVVGEFQMPLWVAEGFSEFASGNAEIENEVFMRDLVLNNRLLPIDQLNDYYGYLAYREGEALFRYVEERYGRKKVFEFLHELKNERSVDNAFNQTFGLSTKKFSQEFEEHLRKRYWPEIVNEGNFGKIGKLLTDHVADGSIYNTAPVISPSGSMVAFISDRNEYSDVYVISALDGRVLRHLISGERSGGFESVHPYRGGISWAPDETAIALTAKAKGRDCLTIVEYPSGKVKQRLFFDLSGIYSPKYSPDGKRVVFVGLKDGMSDIYACDLAGKQLQRVTADIYEDRDPTFSASGDTILFVSDRPDSDAYKPGDYALFFYTPFSAIRQVTPRSGYLAYPAFLPGDSGLAFVTSDSSYDLCVYSLPASRITRRTHFVGGVYYPTLSRDGDRLILAYFRNQGWDIGYIKDPRTSIPLARDTLLTASSDTARYEKSEPEPSRIKPYGFNLTPDYAIGMASYSGGDLAGYLDLALSDVLGNHRFYLTTNLLGDILNSDFDLEYWNYARRTDFGISLFQQFNSYYLSDPDFGMETRDLGLSGLASYPLDKYSRIEGSPSAIYRDYAWLQRKSQGWVLDTTFNRLLFQLDGAYVFDNTYWGTMTAPERGTRARLEAYASVLSALKFQTAYFDTRNYLKIARRFVWANRGIGIASFGPDAEEFFVGALGLYFGGVDVRGYDYYEFFDAPGTKGLFLSSELRHPLVDKLKLGFPLPIELTDIRGATYMDAGVVWDKELPWLYDTRRNRLEDLKVGIGTGVRFQISYFLLRVDFAWPLSALSIEDPATGKERTRAGTWYFSIGVDF
jgi:Tol biopolymer transport system component